MSTTSKKTQSIPRNYGLILFGLLLAYFLLARLFGFAHIYWLRALNLLITFFVIRAALVSYKRNTSVSFYDQYFALFWIGIRTALWGVLLFSVVLALYLDQVEPSFMQSIAEGEPSGDFFTPVTSSGLVFIEGMISSVACTFIVLQMLKSHTIEKPVQTRNQLNDELQNSH